jgi:hypothetical protein
VGRSRVAQVLGLSGIARYDHAEDEVGVPADELGRAV